MAPGQNMQLEKVIDKVLKSGDVKALDGFLDWDIHEETPINCSQQFLTKLDKLISRSLDQKQCKTASLGLAVLHKCGKNLKLPQGCHGLPGIIAQGLHKKWFDMCRQLWIQHGPQWDETLFNLSEDIFDALMVVHESCKEGTYKITEYFLYPVGHLAVNPRIYILIQKEAIRKFNLILDKIPLDLKKTMKMPKSQDASDIMLKLAGQILEGGDHDFQTALMEALCRMATPDQRKEWAVRWFIMEHVASAFLKIRDSEFETDCRKFLNLVNGMQGDRRRVYSYPCVEVYLDKYELLMPADEKLEEFWIDFNLGSHSISFYFSLADEEAQEGQWETICITENEVQSYTVTEERRRHVLQIKLSEMVVVGTVEGSCLTILFSSSLDILQAASSVFGHNKNKGFVGKTSTSVVKTTVKIIMDENNSQVVPESQVSIGLSEKSTAPYLLSIPSAPVQVVAPAKMKMSESSSFIRSSAGRSDHGAVSLSVMPSTKGKRKPSLEMVCSCDRKDELDLGNLRISAKTCSRPTPNSAIAGGMIEQNIPESRAVDMVRTGEGEEQSQEHSFVPDTQPISVRNTSSNWSKLSVSEMLMMPTQKIDSLPRSEPCSNLSQQQDCLSAQKLSVSVPVSQKQLQTQLVHRLQQVLNERNQAPVPNAPVAFQRKKSDIEEDSKDRNSDHQADHCAPKNQHAKINGLAKGKSKGMNSTEIDATLIKAPARASTMRALQEKFPPNVKVKTNRDLSSKEKRDAVLAGSMVKLISSRYESLGKETAEKKKQNGNPSFIHRPIFNMSLFSTAKREVSGPKSQMKIHSKTAGSSTRQRKDIVTINTETPLITGEKNKIFNDTSAISSSDIHDSTVISTTKKRRPMAKEKRHVNKHLFSDSDTDCAMTELSWLRESGRKSHPKITKYSRKARVKPKAVSHHTSYESPNSAPSSRKPVKPNTKSNEKKPIVKPAAAPSRPHVASRRSQRAAAISAKSYKEPDTDGSQSESETPPVSKKCFVNHQGKNEKICSEIPAAKKRKSSEQSANTCRKLDSNDPADLKNPSGLQQQRLVPETSKLNKRSLSHAEKQMNAFKDSWAACQTPSCPSPPFVERMRSAERSDPTLGLTRSPLLTPRGSPLPASPNPACQDTPSPILLLPNPRSKVSNKGKFKSSFVHTAEKKHSSSKTQSIHSVPSLASLTLVGQTPARPSVAEISPVQQCQTSLPPSPLPALPLLTSTLLEPEPAPQSPLPEDTDNHGCYYGFSKVSLVSQVSLSLLNSTVKDGSTASLASKTEISPPSDRDRKPAELHISGANRKRLMSMSSISKEDKKEEKKRSKMRGLHSPRMKPRKLFKSFTEVSAESELTRVMSSSHTVSSSHRNTEVKTGDIDMDEDLELPKIAFNPSNICQQFSSELKKKLENRVKMMEIYRKQSLKTIQQHVSSLNIQLNKSRTQRLEKVQKVLSEEILKLEESNAVLESMGKDLTMYWKKQSVAFHSYREEENRRNETLKKVLQNNGCHSLEYEERLFMSQMCLIRKDMKSVQDRLLSQMQEGEIQSVKRALHALFFS